MTEKEYQRKLAEGRWLRFLPYAIIAAAFIFGGF